MEKWLSVPYFWKLTRNKEVNDNDSCIWKLNGWNIKTYLFHFHWYYMSSLLLLCNQISNNLDEHAVDKAVIQAFKPLEWP